MTDLYLSVDPGSSQTKIIYQSATAKSPSYLLMPPSTKEITHITLQKFLGQQGWGGSPAPENRAWLEIEERFFVVGLFASFFDPSDRISEPKYEKALYKVLAAIGAIIHKLDLVTSVPLKVHLGLLLPWDEYCDRHRFQERLQKMVRDYKFGGHQVQVNLQRFLCRPEGGGLAATHIRQQGVEWFQQRKIGVLMLGHRNTTALLFDGGTLKLGDSPVFGFSLLLDQVSRQKGGLNRDQLATAIFKGMVAAQSGIYGRQGFTGHPDWKRLNEIQALATANDAELRSGEVDDIAKALNVATTDYWDKLKSWLAQTLPNNLDEVIISGGAAVYFQSELEEYFNCEPQYNSDSNKPNGRYSPRRRDLHYSNLIWGAGILELVEKTF